jgi:hypothetical protein
MPDNLNNESQPPREPLLTARTKTRHRAPRARCGGHGAAGIRRRVHDVAVLDLVSDRRRCHPWDG